MTELLNFIKFSEVSNEYEVTMKNKINLLVEKSKIKKKKIIKGIVKREKEKQVVLEKNNIIQQKELNDNIKRENELKKEVLKCQEQLMKKKIIKRSKFPNIQIQVEKTNTTYTFNIVDSNVITNKLPLSIGHYIINRKPNWKLLDYNIIIQYNEFQIKRIVETQINDYCKSKGIIYQCAIV